MAGAGTRPWPFRRGDRRKPTRRSTPVGVLSLLTSTLAAALALKGDIDQAKALAEARRLNPKLSVKWVVGTETFLQPAFDALRKAGLPKGVNAALRGGLTKRVMFFPQKRLPLPRREMTAKRRNFQPAGMRRYR